MEDTMTRRREHLPRLQQEMARLIVDGQVSYRPEDGEYLDAAGEPIGGTRGRALRSMDRQDMLDSHERLTAQTFRVDLRDSARQRYDAGAAAGSTSGSDHAE